jgi:uncharacterized DUF497 family protein
LRFEFDPSKDAANRVKHGVSLARGKLVFEDLRYVVLPSIRPIDGEDRFKAVGCVGSQLWTVVYVERGSAVRLISVRRSNRGEQRIDDRNPGGFA